MHFRLASHSKAMYMVPIIRCKPKVHNPDILFYVLNLR